MLQLPLAGLRNCLGAPRGGCEVLEGAQCFIQCLPHFPTLKFFPKELSLYNMGFTSLLQHCSVWSRRRPEGAGGSALIYISLTPLPALRAPKHGSVLLHFHNYEEFSALF